MVSYLKRFENKIFKYILPKNLYLKWAWNNEFSTTRWYETVRKNRLRNLRRPEYKNFIAAIENVLHMDNSLGIDLGCGDFRVTEHLMEKCPDAQYLGIDFSKIAIKSEKKITEKHENLKFICSDIMHTNNWMPYIKKNYGGNHIVVFTYGVFMYLSGKELSSLLNSLHTLNRLRQIVSIEPDSKENLDTITSKKKERSYLHNYKLYLHEAGYQITKSQYLFDNEYVFIIAKPKHEQKEFK